MLFTDNGRLEKSGNCAAYKVESGDHERPD